MNNKYVLQLRGRSFIISNCKTLIIWSHNFNKGFVLFRREMFDECLPLQDVSRVFLTYDGNEATMMQQRGNYFCRWRDGLELSN